jgi:Mn2+/Fe2+ NRAMP family transporter
LSTLVFIAVGKPTQLLLLAGMINGLILPVALATLLIAGSQPALMNNYRHPRWMQWAGWLVVFVMGWMGFGAVQEWLNGTLFR